MPTTRQIWEKGDELCNWMCDINPETGEMQSNGGIEHIFEFRDEQYSVITDVTETILYEPDTECVPLKEKVRL